MPNEKNSKDKEPLTDFGFESVSFAEKTKKVGEVFSSVASNYNLMNDLMSLGVHRHWKRFAIDVTDIGPNQRVLDLATGSGDLGLLMANKMKQLGELFLSDINPDMLSTAKDNFIDHGFLKSTYFVLANAETLPFPDNYFDRVTIAFGLRNVADKPKALASIYRVLKPGGFCIVLEFSRPVLPLLKKIYDAYSFSVIPWLGKLVADDEASYRYLVESIRMHPDQENLKEMMLESGFDHCKYFNLTGGVVALHKGYKS